ncbi:MAG TPA: hypothetical protein PKA42_01640 [Candidatus Paceibacterota bacterium]|mgnify:CR=1 FL=1|nr:hypothetical protein [Candidatus Paceibacterota bacterium]HMO82846.1 hypothetical protein [Candidatus Paceibacterota bacterium]
MVAVSRAVHFNHIHRRTLPARKEVQKNGREFLHRKKNRQVSERLRTMCHEAIKKIGPDAEKVSEVVISRLHALELGDQYELELPRVLQRIMAAHGSRFK